jgi:hypothetical protein
LVQKIARAAVLMLHICISKHALSVLFDHTSNVGMHHSMAIPQENNNNFQEEANGLLLYLGFCCNFLQIRSGSLGALLCFLTTEIFFQAM